MCQCEAQRLKVCYHFLCAYHYERVQQHFKTHDEEMHFFEAWCDQHAVTNAMRLWNILRGEMTPHPRDSYSLMHVSEVINETLPAKGKTL